MATSTRERILRTAHDLFYSESFHSVGLDRILKEVGVTKTTFYNHFSSKDDLVLEALREHDAWWRDTFLALLRKRAGEDPREQLLGIFDALEEILVCDSFNGCIFINVAVEFPLAHDPAHIAAAEHKAKMVELLRDIAQRAGADDPEALARELALLLEGAYVTRQVTGDTGGVIETAGRLARMAVDRRAPAPA